MMTVVTAKIAKTAKINLHRIDQVTVYYSCPFSETISFPYMHFKLPPTPKNPLFINN